jgi:hypothetical protein
LCRCIFRSIVTAKRFVIAIKPAKELQRKEKEDDLYAALVNYFGYGFYLKLPSFKI